MLNGRRGSEALTIILQDFEEKEVWIAKGPRSNRYALAFIMGKANVFVPVLIRRDCEDGMRIFADTTARVTAGISNENVLFAYTQHIVLIAQQAGLALSIAICAIGETKFNLANKIMGASPIWRNAKMHVKVVVDVVVVVTVPATNHLSITQHNIKMRYQWFIIIEKQSWCNVLMRRGTYE